MHNIAYLGAAIFQNEQRMDQAGNVDIGSTLFADSHPIAGLVMKVGYFVYSPICWVVDLIVEGAED